MSQSFNHFKKRLLEKKQALLSIIEGTKDNSKAVTLDQTSVGRLSRMDAMQGQAMAEEVKKRLAFDPSITLCTNCAR